jgi:hypothetical protein
MSKIYHCACCGQQLDFYRKAVPRKGTILNLIAPHNCESTDIKPLEEFETVPAPHKPKAELDKLFKSFPFVEKINKDGLADPLPITDRRPKENLRKELNTTAPPNLVDMAKGLTGTRPTSGRELEVPDGEAE